MPFLKMLFELPFKCHLSNVTFQMSPFKCHFSNVAFQMSPSKCQQPLNVNRISILTLLFFICDFFKAKVPLTRLSDTTFWPRHDYRVRSKERRDRVVSCRHAVLYIHATSSQLMSNSNMPS